MKEEKLFSKYETARILGARALQIAMNAPLLIKITPEDLEKIKYDALKIAEVEFESGILPISVRKPFPEKKDEELKRAREKKISDEKKKALEENIDESSKEAGEEGEIMELAKPEDEADEEAGGEEEAGDTGE